MRERGEHDYDDEDTYGMDEDDDAPSDPFTEQWADMHDIFMQSLQKYVTVQVKKKYTAEEQEMGIENVRTGLKQALVDSDDEEDEDEEEEDEAEEQAVPAGAGAGAPPAAGGQQAVEPEFLFCLAAKGDLRLAPRDFPFESRPVQARNAGRPAPPR